MWRPLPRWRLLRRPLAADRSALVLSAIATALGVRETAHVPLRETLSRLREQRRLLVLDNCEQVVAAAVDVAALLAACPNLVILATSRMPWHIRAEREFPLSAAPRRPAADRCELAHVPAVTLFIEHGRSTRIRADRGERGRHRGHLPPPRRLAAGHRAGRGADQFLPPTTLLARLEHRLAADRRRALPARQQTMRDAIAWVTTSSPPRNKRSSGAWRCSPAASPWRRPRRWRMRALLVLAGVFALVEQSLLRQMPAR